jgi:hypothetical protein
MLANAVRICEAKFGTLEQQLEKYRHELVEAREHLAEAVEQQTCSGSEHSQCAGTFNAISGVIDWLFAPKWDLYLGIMSTTVNGGLANGYLERNNIATTAGLRFRF